MTLAHLAKSIADLVMYAPSLGIFNFLWTLEDRNSYDEQKHIAEYSIIYSNVSVNLSSTLQLEYPSLMQFSFNEYLSSS
jgi:hypothetical protein